MLLIGNETNDSRSSRCLPTRTARDPHSLRGLIGYRKREAHAASLKTRGSPRRFLTTTTPTFPAAVPRVAASTARRSSLGPPPSPRAPRHDQHIPVGLETDPRRPESVPSEDGPNARRRRTGSTTPSACRGC